MGATRNGGNTYKHVFFRRQISGSVDEFAVRYVIGEHLRMSAKHSGGWSVIHPNSHNRDFG